MKKPKGCVHVPDFASLMRKTDNMRFKKVAYDPVETTSENAYNLRKLKTKIDDVCSYLRENNRDELVNLPEGCESIESSVEDFAKFAAESHYATEHQEDKKERIKEGILSLNLVYEHLLKNIRESLLAGVPDTVVTLDDKLIYKERKMKDLIDDLCIAMFGVFWIGLSVAFMFAFVYTVSQDALVTIIATLSAAALTYKLVMVCVEFLHHSALDTFTPNHLAADFLRHHNYYHPKNRVRAKLRKYLLWKREKDEQDEKQRRLNSAEKEAKEALETLSQKFAIKEFDEKVRSETKVLGEHLARPSRTPGK